MQTKQLNFVGLHQSCDLCDRLLVIGIDVWFLNFQTIVVFFKAIQLVACTHTPAAVFSIQTTNRQKIH